jgi:hypothetical protein
MSALLKAKHVAEYDANLSGDRKSVQDAYEEASYYFTLMQFETLLHKHGLTKLLKDMSDESSHALLVQAADMEYGV